MFTICTYECWFVVVIGLNVRPVRFSSMKSRAVRASAFSVESARREHVSGDPFFHGPSETPGSPGPVCGSDCVPGVSMYVN